MPHSMKAFVILSRVKLIELTQSTHGEGEKHLH